MFCANILHNRPGQFFGVHSHIFFLNSSGDLIFLISGVESAHIFGPKEDIVSDP